MCVACSDTEGSAGRGMEIARFLSRLAVAEAGALGVVPELRQLVATSDALAEFLCERDELALRFDAVVARWKAAA